MYIEGQYVAIDDLIHIACHPNFERQASKGTGYFSYEELLKMGYVKIVRTTKTKNVYTLTDKGIGLIAGLDILDVYPDWHPDWYPDEKPRHIEKFYLARSKTSKLLER